MPMKAQIWSLDLAMSLLIFSTALLSAFFAWSYISINVLGNQELKELQLKTLTISDSLIRTPGLPENWNASTVQVIGLASDENVLNRTKVLGFIGMNYNQSKAVLGIGNYEFYFEIRYINGTVYENTTQPISVNSTTVVPVERYASYMGKIAKVRFVIWK